jgi:hypothetical protein
MPPEPPPGYSVRVAGDAQYQEALQAIVASRPVGHSADCLARARLGIGESAFDRDAVVVEIGGLTVGYLGLAEARRYRALPRPPVDVPSLIVGVPERPGASERLYQVWLALTMAG